MCGRYTNEMEFSQLRLAFDATDLSFRPWVPTYNIAPSSGPGHEQPFIVRGAGGRELRLGRFWLIPSWWKQPLRELPTAFNARAEELAQKPLWREPFRSRRCLVPATGWREFALEKGKKQPYHFHLDRSPERSILKQVTRRMEQSPPVADFGPRRESAKVGGGSIQPPSGRDEVPFAFAGLASTWLSPEADQVDSFAIITTEPTEEAARVHDRMPLVLPPSLYEPWLADDRNAQAVLEEAVAQSRLRQVKLYPSHPIGNDTRFEGREAIARISLGDAGDGQAPRRGAEPERGQLSLPLAPAPGRRRS